MDMGHLDVVSSPHAMALDVVAHVYHDLPQQPEHSQRPQELQHLFECDSVSNLDVVVHALDEPLVDQAKSTNNAMVKWRHNFELGILN